MVPPLNKAALKKHQPIRIDRAGLRKSAVLVPLVPERDEIRIILTARHHALRFQPGDISFPGGKANLEEDVSACALREAEEEISLAPVSVEILGELDHVIVRSRYAVAPFVGMVAPGAPIAPAVQEVSRLIYVSPSDLFSPKAFDTITRIDNGVPRIAYQFTVGGIVIWGATARILKSFMEIGYGARYPNSTSGLPLL